MHARILIMIGGGGVKREASPADTAQWIKSHPPKDKFGCNPQMMDIKFMYMYTKCTNA